MTARGYGDFRPVQYLGSKWRILDQVSGAIDTVTNPLRPTVGDLFAGSGVVARHLAHTRPVFASDIQEYSRVLSSALLRPGRVNVEAVMRDVAAEAEGGSKAWLDELLSWESEAATSQDWAETLARTIESGSVAGVSVESLQDDWPELASTRLAAPATDSRWTLLRHYGGVYFSYRQATDLDSIAEVVRRLDPPYRDTAVAALLSAASEIVSSIGSHFAQPIRPRTPSGGVKQAQLSSIATTRSRNAVDVFAEKLRKFASLRMPEFEGNAKRASFDDAMGTLPEAVGTIYADPPYTRDHYSRFYHVLETIALGDEPGISTVKVKGRDTPSRGLYRVDRHQSPFSIVSQAPAAFRSLFEFAANRQISVVLSYSPVPENDKPRARVIAMDHLLAIAAEQFRHVTLLNARGMRHSKFNESSKNAPPVDEAEVLIVCR